MHQLGEMFIEVTRPNFYIFNLKFFLSNLAFPHQKSIPRYEKVTNNYFLYEKFMIHPDNIFV